MEKEILEALKQRILDDTVYCQRRLGRIPSEDEVEAAAEPVAQRAYQALALWLDDYESDVWTLLEVLEP